MGRDSARPGKRSWVVALGLAAGLIFHTGQALAGCRTTCELVTQPAFVDPPLDCADIHVVGAGCTCRVMVTFINHCSVPLEFTRTELESCSASASGTNCHVIAPESGDSVDVVAGGNGALHADLFFIENDTEHRVQIDAQVSHFEDVSCACHLGGPSSSSERGAYGVAGLVLALLWRRRPRPPHRASGDTPAAEQRERAR